MAKTGKGPAQLKFGRYNALTKLGQGAMATVYLAEDPSLNRMVAIKVIHTHLASNSSLLDRFTVEAKTAAVLRNPNIVEIFDYGVEDDTQYLVMEYIDGPNLQFVLNLLGGEPMAPEVAAAVICQAADGLCVAEKTGVVHRDIKPENMMFTSEGQLKIADFGIAHIAEQNLTQTGSILGSPNFMSPEQIDGRKPTHQTDLFSLGAVFYYCLTGQKPFSGSNIPTIMRGICDLPHVPVSDMITNSDPFLENLVDTLLQKNPEDRGKGSRWLSLQLRGYLNQKGILDLTEVTKGLLEKSASMGGSMTMVDTTPAPGPEERSGSGKKPLQAGMRVDRPKTPTGSGSGVRPGTWQASKGTAHGLKTSGGRSQSGSDLDFSGKSGSGSRHGSPASQKGLWIGGGILAAAILTAAVLVVVLGGKDESPATAAKQVEETKPAPPRKITVASVILQPASMELPVGQSRKFILDVQPAGAPSEVRWESSNPDVASIHGGEVVGMRAGQVVIKAVSTEDGAKVGSADVTVTGGYAAQPAPDPRPNPTPTPTPNPNPGLAQKNPGNKQPGTTETNEVDSRAEDFAGNPSAAKPPATAKAILTITSAPPFAEVIVDGRFLGTTPVKDKELPVGKHKIQVQHRSFPSMDTVLNLGAGEKTIRFRLFR